MITKNLCKLGLAHKDHRRDTQIGPCSKRTNSDHPPMTGVPRDSKTEKLHSKGEIKTRETPHKRERPNSQTAQVPFSQQRSQDRAATSVKKSVASPPSSCLPPFPQTQKMGKAKNFSRRQRWLRKKGGWGRNPRKQVYGLPFRGAIRPTSFSISPLPGNRNFPSRKALVFIFHLREIRNVAIQKAFALASNGPPPITLPRNTPI